VTLGGVIVGFVEGTGTNKPNAAIAGGQIGANWQMGMLVVGGEADWQSSWQKLMTQTWCGIFCGSIDESRAIDWFSTARLRAGFSLDRFLVYATGGAAWTSITDEVRAVGTAADLSMNISEHKIGWALGGGLEWAFLGDWSAKIEYLYISANGLTGSGKSGLTTLAETVDLKDSIVRFGVNYRLLGGR
jgi:outer membrane immunogenic protein